jgi:hypothetical protein
MPTLLSHSGNLRPGPQSPIRKEKQAKQVTVTDNEDGNTPNASISDYFDITSASAIG